jgi:hypothetical protein
MSTFKKYFVTPRVPSTAAGFIDDNFAVVDLRRSRRGFTLASSAVTQMPPGIIVPAFDKRNIQDAGEALAIVRQTAEAAGLANRKRWSVALPDGAARSVVVTLESKPEGRRELNEVITWKIERVIPTPVSELFISRQRISPAAGHERYLLTIAHNEVLAQYDEVFASLGWEAGLILPRHLGEAQWLIWDNSPGDKLLVSANREGFTSLVVRNGEPVLVRSYACDREARGDELHRFALYYRDKVADGAAAGLSGMLVLGGFDAAEARAAISDAIDGEPRLMDPAEFGFDLAGEPIHFDHLAGAAGLASLAWQ